MYDLSILSSERNNFLNLSCHPAEINHGRPTMLSNGYNFQYGSLLFEQMDSMADFSRQARNFDPMLSQCWASVVDGGHITLRNGQILDAFRVNFDFWHV